MNGNDTQWVLSSDNLEVVAIEPAVGYPPNPAAEQKLVQFNGVSRLLLTNDTTVYGCNDCGKTDPELQRIVGHMPAHTERAPSLYTDEILMVIIKTVDKYASKKVRDYCERAATELNSKKIFTSRSAPWTAGSVSAIARAHGDRIRALIKAQKQAAITASAQQKPRSTTPRVTVTVTNLNSVLDIKIELNEIWRALQGVSQRVGRVADAVAELDVATDINELREKARKYDELKGLLG